MVDVDLQRTVALGVGAVVVGALLLLVTSPTGPLAGILHPLEYERATVTAVDGDGTTLGSVDVRVADTERERYVGLSETDALDDGEGMLFVFPDAGERTFVMREMAFPLDIVFAAPNGTITTIHHAAVPEDTPDSGLRRYTGRARFVLEVPRGYTNRTEIGVGDRLVIPPNATD